MKIKTWCLWLNISVLLLVSIQTTNAQSSPLSTPDYSRKPQIQFSLSPLFYRPLQLQNTGPSLLHSSSNFGGEAIISYIQPIAKDLNLKIGFGISLVTFNYKFDFPIPAGSAFDIPGQTDSFVSKGYSAFDGQTILVLPLGIQKTVRFNSKPWSLNLEALAQINFREQVFSSSGHGIFGQTDSGAQQYFRLDYESVNDRFNFLSYKFKIGLNLPTGEKNSAQINLVYQTSNQSLSTGTYQFTNLGFESSGTTRQRFGAFGLEFAYNLSAARKNH